MLPAARCCCLLAPAPRLQHTCAHHSGVAAGKGYTVTAAPYTAVSSWMSVLDQTVDTTVTPNRPMISRLHAQLYGSYTVLDQFRSALASRTAWMPAASLPAFLWPGWAPCLFNKHYSFQPSTECGCAPHVWWAVCPPAGHHGVVRRPVPCAHHACPPPLRGRTVCSLAGTPWAATRRMRWARRRPPSSTPSRRPTCSSGTGTRSLPTPRSSRCAPP